MSEHPRLRERRRIVAAVRKVLENEDRPIIEMLHESLRETE